MTIKLKTADVLAIGFMTFAFFLGAGNIIFPPLAGNLAGQSFMPAMFGFLATAVGLPLITIIAVAKAGGGLITMTRFLPAMAATAIAVAIYIIIGPAFAAPRTSLVAYEMGIKPFLGDAANETTLALYSVAFFIITAYFALSQGKLIDNVGKILTPALIVLLTVLAIAVFVMPQGEIGIAREAYVDSPFTKGFLEGYNTMDTFASLMFGMLIINVLKSKGVTDKASQFKYLVMAGSIAAAGLAFVYISLFYLGATSQSLIAVGADVNGGMILATYVQALFGMPGQYILAAVVTLACLTTAVGLASAVAEFFHELKPQWSYKMLVVINCVVCAIVANVGLSQLISISVPVLFAVYPIAIAIVALILLQERFPNPQFAFRLVMVVAFMFGVLDGLKVAGLAMSGFEFLPLFDQGLAWVLPTALAIVVSIVAMRSPKNVAVAIAK
ncbi:branched-chain amino acid transport system II carrier protein [Moritella marina ATCC 15381]|uniref:Branched-chain amino acid transport system carrier protein n=1 Tax=Moritella marina ATCC 15381 TaxID=1202962 RepID=A0A5J6WRR3_MORMI|nr:branched-chain amino acid transport system II carrier protein [Moritella marina]QFI39092.1 branched-chain amino acid transport system II carrier protein [Moritella marina ATCC 15381]